ncbi:MAG: cytochrome c [Betaproteobacteria bacterium]|nr:MAG: cytochrome c [Betaproteobacteria bacterium]
MTRSHLLLAAVLSAFVSTSPAAQGSAEAAKTKLSMCIGCHGIPGYRTSYPDVYPVPKLGGQHPEYILSALAAYRSGERSHPTMRGIAEGLSEQDMADLAAYYSAGAQSGTTPPPANDKAQLCAACHGPDGNSPTSAFPRIAGQHRDYLYQALQDYKAGRRKNPIMAAQVESLSKQDMEALAAWFSSQSGLYVKR